MVAVGSMHVCDVLPTRGRAGMCTDEAGFVRINELFVLHEARGAVQVSIGIDVGLTIRA